MQLFTVDEEYKRIQTFVNTLYPDPDSFQKVIPAEQQADELVKLRQGLRTEQFFFIVDFVNLNLSHITGLSALGYQDETFTFRKYLSMIPNGGMLQLITLLGKQTFRMADTTSTAFMRPKLVSNMPLQHANGKTLLLKRTISPWQLNQEGKITAYVSEFIILKDYEGEPLNPRFIDLDPAIENAYNQIIRQLFANLPARQNLFSPKEMEILRLYAADQQGDLTAKEIALATQTQPMTIQGYHKTILMKAKQMFGEDLPVKTARDVSTFLQKNRLLS